MSDLSAREEGFRNALERNIGSEEYGRIKPEGHDRPNDRGQYDAAEVITEFRSGDHGTVDETFEYFQSLRDDGVKFNQRARKYLNKIQKELAGTGGNPGTDGGETQEYKFDPEIAGAIERSANYRDRAISGQTAQDIYGTSALNAAGNASGIPVGDPAGGVPDQNKAIQASDSEIHRFLDPEQFKLQIANRARQAVLSKFS